MKRIDYKFEAAVSDTDILIDLYKCDSFKILSLLFNKIYIPEYIFEKELKKVGSREKDISLLDLNKCIYDDSLFEIVFDKNIDVPTKLIKKTIIQELRDIAGPGEVECVSYAKAAGINFVVSNNHTEFIYLNDVAVMLSYHHILAICVMHKKITISDAEKMYKLVNSLKSRPSSHSFNKKLKESWKYFCDNNYLDVLHITHCTGY